MFRPEIFAALKGAPTSLASSDALVGLIASLTGLGIFVAFAVYVLSKLRGATGKSKTPSVRDDLVKFGALYESGKLTKEEFSMIKRSFAASLDAELAAKKAEEAKNSPEAARDARLANLLRNEKR
ncbi:MAG: hypothetical protein IKW13_01280 [Thermoguttaceae bacterium]|nr:hypothetical protein [Thermoguttaceae bacterium]